LQSGVQKLGICSDNATGKVENLNDAMKKCLQNCARSTAQLASEIFVVAQNVLNLFGSKS
jgi:hypothetical protein